MGSRINFAILLACALRRFRRDRKGASAIEFALVAPMTLIGLIGPMEISFMFYATQYLETATQDATRMIMTGQVKSSSMSKEAFKAIVCEKTKLMFDCTNLYVDAQAYTDFSKPDFSTSPMPISNKKFVDNTQFITGKQGDIVVVQAFYAWPVFLAGFFGYDQSNLQGGKRLLSATAAVRNEPWVN
jgi:Flp pilus assembly protein TadG